MIPRLLVLLVSAFTISSCHDFGSEPPLSFYQGEIRDALFRYQFLHNYSGHPYQDPQDRDQAEDFIHNFQAHLPPVKEFSSATLSGQGVFDSQTGDRGLLFRAGEIEPASEGVVKVYGGYFENGGSFSLDLYLLRKLGGQWVVEKDSLLGIG